MTSFNASWFAQPSLLILLPFCKLLYILASHSTPYLSIRLVVGQTVVKAYLLVMKRIKVVFKDFWQVQFWIHILHIFLRIINDPEKICVIYTYHLTPHLSHLSSLFYLSQLQWSSHPLMIAILLLPFPVTTLSPEMFPLG